MTQTLNGADALAALFGQAATDANDADAPPQVQRFTCRVPHDVLLEQLLAAVDDLVPFALNELRPIRRRLWSWWGSDADDADDAADAPTAQTMTRRIRGVELAWTMTVVLGPELRRLADLDQPGRYLAPFDGALRSHLWGARRAYCTAIAAALDDEPPETIEYWQNEGSRLVGQFRVEMQGLYLHDPKGLQALVADLEQVVLDLVALRAQRGGDALPRRAADGEALIPTSPADVPWYLRRVLLDELEAIRAASFSRDIAERFVVFSETLQGLTAAVQLSATRERLSWLADQPWLPSDEATRVQGYVVELGVALTHAENAIAARKLGNHVEAGAEQRMAATAAAEVTGRARFKADVDELSATLQLQAEVKAIAAGVAIAAATAVTAGAAGAAAGMALATIVDTTTVFGALVVSGGVLATRTVWETVVARSGSEILLGPDSIKDSTFAADLGWQALQTVVGKVVLYGCGDIFKAIEKAGERGRAAAKVAEFAVEQVTTFGFGEVQHLIKNGKTRTWRETVVAAVGQAAGVGVVAVGGLLATSFATRLGADPGTPDGRAALAKVDSDRAALMADFEPIKNGTASDAEFVAWAQRAAGVWNRYVDVVRGMPEGQPKQTALTQLVLAKGAIELRLAELGISATLTVPGSVPLFEGLLPGMVAVSDEARPVLDAEVPAAQRRPTTAEDGVLAAGPDGRRRLFLPARTLPELPPRPAALAHVPEANAVPALPADPSAEVPPALDPIAAIGLERLKVAAPKRWRAVLGRVADGEAESFLSLLAHPELADGGSLRTRVQALASLGSDADSLQFARLWGPDLALWLRRRCGTTGADFRRDLARADALLAAEPEATRAALVARMTAAPTSNALRLILGTGVPPRPRPVRPTAANLGVDVTSPMWRLLRREVLDHRPDLDAAAVTALTNVRMALRMARSPILRGLPAAVRRQMLLDFDVMLVQAGIRPAPGMQGDHRPANGYRGAYAEYLFLPAGMERSTRWLGKKRHRSNAKGRSDMDGHIEVGGVHVFAELKSDLIHTQTAAEQRATAQRYLADARADVVDNLPPGSRYYLWFLHPPQGGQAAIDALRAILVTPGGPITDVFFGPETPAPLVFAGAGG